MEDPIEKKKRIKQLFRDLDYNNSGMIKAEQVARRLDELAFKDQKLPLSSTVNFGRELVRACDKSKDGSIVYDEFEDFVIRKEYELMKLFKQVDVGKDGKICVKDLVGSFASAGVAVSNKELTDFVLHLDKNNNGGISFEEWRDFLLLFPHKTTLENVIQIFQSLSIDSNADANINPVPFGLETKLKYFWAGGVAGAVSRTVTAPLDRLKVLLQTQTYKTRIPTKDVYLKAILKIYNDGGIPSFFRGNGLNVLKIFPESALKFFTFEHCKSLIGDPETIGIGERFLAGGMAGLVSQFVIYPIETLKTRVMAQIVNTEKGKIPIKDQSIYRNISHLYAENGIKAFYRGCTPALIGIIPYAGIDLAVFETLKSAYNKTADSTKRTPAWVILSFGMLSGTCSACLMYPLSLIRTRQFFINSRLQAQGTPSHPTYYKSSFDVIKKTYSREGLYGFYKGLTPTLAKVLPAGSISYVIYENMKHHLNIP